MKRLSGLLLFTCTLALTFPVLAADAVKATDKPLAVQTSPAGEAPAANSEQESATPAATSETMDPSEAPAGEASASATPSASPAPAAAEASHGEAHLPDVKWSFDGPFGTYDRAALQRGFQVYTQVCSTCHSMKRLSYRNLTALGYSEAEVKAIAASHTVQDGPNDEGEMFDRPGLPSDHFVSPFPNAKAAAYANNGATPPDMSLLAKARHGGASYIYGILIGYGEPPAGHTLLDGQHWNKYMPGNIIAMPQPIQDGQVAYEDGSPQTVDQYARDVSAFLTWAAEPHMEDRKRTGLKALMFLLVFTGIMYAVKKKVWANAH